MKRDSTLTDCAAVIGLVERNGRVYARPVQNTNARTLQAVVRERVEQGTLIFTDELSAYQGLEGDYGRNTINHSAGQYVSGSIHTNTIEGYWSQLKRGIYHQVSAKHLHRYCAEFDYRYNTRKSGEVARFDGALKYTNGRLMFKTLTGKDQ